MCLQARLSLRKPPQRNALIIGCLVHPKKLVRRREGRLRLDLREDILFACFYDGVLLCSLGQLGTHCGHLVGLELAMIFLPWSPRVLGLKVCAVTPSPGFEVLMNSSSLGKQDNTGQKG